MRVSVILTGLALAAAPALADETPAPGTQQVYDCLDLADDSARLACFDASVTALKSAETAGEITTVSRADVEEVQKDAFGFAMPSLPRLVMPKFGGGDDDGALTEVTFNITKVERSNRQDRLIVTLENGQVWRQTDPKSVYYSKKRGADVATIKRGTMGSFKMKLDGGTAFRVERIE
jgi:hypothetical protein